MLRRLLDLLGQSIMLCLALGLISCGESEFSGSGGRRSSADGNAASSQYITETFAQLMRGVDIVVAIDSSGSMLDEQQALERNLDKFVTDLEAVQLGSHVTVIGAPSFRMPTNAPADKFAVVPRKIGSHDAIAVLTDFFTKGTPPLPFRDGAGLEVIIVSDDNGLPYQGYRAEDFKGPANKTTIVNAIVGLESSQATSTCTIESVGTEHIKLAQTTGGSILDLCYENWDQLVQQLTANIINRNAGFPLKEAPDLSRDIVVYVDDQIIPKGQYTIDAKQKTIRFSQEVNITADSTIRVSYYTDVKPAGK